MRVFNLGLAVCALSIQTTVAHAIGSTKFLPKRDPCVPLSQGYETIDDSPTINDALKACGDGGTIVLPADQIYSIHSTIDFSPCKNCDFQLEGRLIVASGQWPYWREVGSTFSIANVTGARIRSVTGKGVVDGNAIEYYTSRYDSGYSGWTPVFAHVNQASSNISFENLTFKNVMHKFFRIEGNSDKITFSNLNLTLEEQWGTGPRNEVDAAGIELGKSTNVKISNVNMIFKARKAVNGPIGFCVALDAGAHNVEVRDINCTGAWGGVIVSLRTIGNATITEEDKKNTVSNVYVTGLRFDGSLATGFQCGGVHATMKNITWDGVTVVSGTPVVASLCYLKGHYMTGWPITCAENMAATVTDVWFKRYRGKLPSEADRAKRVELYTNSTLEYHFEDWQSTEVV